VIGVNLPDKIPFTMRVSLALEDGLGGPVAVAVVGLELITIGSAAKARAAVDADSFS
jgi:hypothetical protein